MYKKLLQLSYIVCFVVGRKGNNIEKMLHLVYSISQFCKEMIYQNLF